MFLCGKDVKITILSSITAGVLQILSKRSIQKHPKLEFLKDTQIVSTCKQVFRVFFPRIKVIKTVITFEIAGVQVG